MENAGPHLSTADLLALEGTKEEKRDETPHHQKHLVHSGSTPGILTYLYSCEAEAVICIPQWGN